MENSTPLFRYHLPESLGTRVTLVMSTLTSLLYITAIGVAIGLIFKFLQITGQELVFIGAMVFLALLLLVQTGLSLVYIYRHLLLAFLGAFSSLSLAMAVVTFIFLFQGWWGSYIMIFLTMPLFLVSFSFLIWFFITGHHRHTVHRKFIYANILAPYLFVLILALVYALQPERRIDFKKANGKAEVIESGVHSVVAVQIPEAVIA